MLNAIFLSALLIFSVAASTCPVNSPFSSFVVGKSLSMNRPCDGYRFFAYSSVSVNETELRYKPFQGDYSHGSENPGHLCAQTYLFQIRKWSPKLIELPRLQIPSGINPYGEYCEREQAKRQSVYWPRGATREQFIAGLNATINGLTYLRDHECRDQQSMWELPQLHSEAYLNPWLDVPISYLLSVAQNFDICLDLSQ